MGLSGPDRAALPPNHYPHLGRKQRVRMTGFHHQVTKSPGRTKPGGIRGFSSGGHTSRVFRGRGPEKHAIRLSPCPVACDIPSAARECRSATGPPRGEPGRRRADIATRAGGPPLRGTTRPGNGLYAPHRPAPGRTTLNRGKTSLRGNGYALRWKIVVDSWPTYVVIFAIGLVGNG